MCVSVHTPFSKELRRKAFIFSFLFLAVVPHKSLSVSDGQFLKTNQSIFALGTSVWNQLPIQENACGVKKRLKRGTWP